MENDPKEIELNFNDSSAPAEEEISGVLPEVNIRENAVVWENTGNEEFAGNDAGNDAASFSSGTDVLRSQQPMNRPAGTPPLVSNPGEGRISTMEMLVAGKSCGTALRLLREQSQLSHKDIEQATLIQTHYLEALESENLSALPPLVYVIAFIRSLCNFYHLSNETTSQLVAKLKEQLEYTCNEGMMNSLDVDSSGAEVNEKRMKRIVLAAVGVLVLLVVLIILIVGLCKESDTPQVKVVDVPAGKQQHFDPNTIDSLLQPPTLDLPKLPVAE